MFEIGFEAAGVSFSNREYESDIRQIAEAEKHLNYLNLNRLKIIDKETPIKETLTLLTYLTYSRQTYTNSFPLFMRKSGIFGIGYILYEAFPSKQEINESVAIELPNKGSLLQIATFDSHDPETKLTSFEYLPPSYFKFLQFKPSLSRKLEEKFSEAKSNLNNKKYNPPPEAYKFIMRILQQ